MSTLYLGTDLEILASRLLRELDHQVRTGDFFVTTTLVVPNRTLGRWLKLWLARNFSIAINLKVCYLEQALWDLLREVDPRPHESPPEVLDGDRYRLLTLSILLENAEPGLEYWQNFLQRAEVGGGELDFTRDNSPSPPTPLPRGERGERAPDPLPHGERGARTPTNQLFARRAWGLADQLASLIRDYEYHRQEALIQPWLKRSLALGADWANLEQAQLAVFHAVTREPTGKRALLNSKLKRNFKTLPQYAMEVMEHYELQRLPMPKESGRTVYLFGISQVSHLHARALRWLGRFFDLRVYHYNSQAGRLPAKPVKQNLEDWQRMVAGEETRHDVPGMQLLQSWGRAGADSLWTMGELLGDRHGFQLEILPTERRESNHQDLFSAAPPSTVLARLQDHVILGGAVPTRMPARMPQDRSLQIAACPGIVREVETVYESILANLQQTPDLKQTDIAILATDMEHYRPVLQSVFEKQPRRVHFNLADFSAAGVSALGQGLLDMLDLALESFTRSRVFTVLLNPCVLARFGVTHTEALTWLDWTHSLGIYQSWDRSDKQSRGYPASPFYGWKLGLQRLRLGGIMEVGNEDGAALSRFGPVIPFSDLHSSDREQLNVFCVLVEGLLPRLMKLRHFQGSAEQWVPILEAMLKDFLAVPEDRPEEDDVRTRLLEALQNWKLWDHLGDEPTKLNLALVREMVQGVLQGIQGTRGQFPAGGISIAGLQPFKPLPFRIIYVVGLGEDLFPGSNALSGLDLRNHARLPGDIRPAEFRRYLFLETILSAREKLYLFYNSLETQRDQVLHPAVPLQQLQRYLNEHILESDMEVVDIPLLPTAETLLEPVNSAKTDLLVQHAEMQRLLAWTDLDRQGRLELNATQFEELKSRRETRQPAFKIDETGEPKSSVPTVTLNELRQFLRQPAQAAAERHLRIRDDEVRDFVDNEPFVSEAKFVKKLIRETLQELILQAVEGDVETVMAGWPATFEQIFADRQRRGQVPEHAFGEVDCKALLEQLDKRIRGRNQLENFLTQRRSSSFVGPVLIGESAQPVGARFRFPALTLQLTRDLPQLSGREARLTGSIPFAWRDERSFDALFLTESATQIANSAISSQLLKPFLFFLAMRAGGEGNPATSAWLGEREFRIHLLHAVGITTITYRPEHASPDAAHEYLAQLATDFLDSTSFDLIPLERITDKSLSDAYMANETQLTFKDSYRDQLTDAIEDKSFRRDQRPTLQDLIHAEVPDDAYAKVRRRFRPIASPFLR